MLLPLIAAVLLGNGSPAAAEELARYRATVAAGSHSLTVPWHPGPVTDRFHPAVAMGGERRLTTRGRLELYLAADLGLFRHYWWMTGVSVEPGLGLGCRLPVGLRADVKLGVGYLHYFWRRPILELEDGRYAVATDWGRPSLVVPLSVMVGYRGTGHRPLVAAPFLSARWMAQALFADQVPLVPHFQLLLGVRVDLEPVVSRLRRGS